MKKQRGLIFFIFVVIFIFFSLSVEAYSYDTFGSNSIGLTEQLQDEKISEGEGGGAGGIAPDSQQRRFILIKAYDIEAGGIDYLDNEVINFANRISNFFSLNSYGQTAIVGADGNPFNEDDIFGPYALDLPDECDSQYIARAIYAQAPREIFFDGLRVIILINDGCFPNAYGYPVHINFGSEENPLILRFVIGEGIDNLDEGTFTTIAHEIAHGYMGIGHTAYRPCNPSQESSPEDCEVVFEYGSPYDILGGSSALGHSNANMLDRADWLREDGEHGILNVQEDGEYIIKSISSSEPGIKALKFPHKLNQEFYTGIPEFLYLEWHTPQGLDINIQNQNLFTSDIFNGALLHIKERHFATLIHPIPLQAGLLCPSSEFTSTTCPRNLRAFNTALPFGQTYTDPNTNTRITILPPTAAGLPIQVDVGRTDFTPPTINSIEVVERPDPCTAIVEVDAFDPGHENEEDRGISKVEFYEWGGNYQNSRLIGEVRESPYRITLDERVILNNIWARVYDNANVGEGISPDNYADSENLDWIEHLCSDIPPTITIESPIFQQRFDGGIFSTAGVEPDLIREIGATQAEDIIWFYNLGDLGDFYSPIPLHIRTESENSFILIFSLDETLNGRILRNINANFYAGTAERRQDSELNEILNLDSGHYEFSIKSQIQSGSETLVKFGFNVIPSSPFLRGNANGDNRLDLSDAISTLNFLFRGGAEPSCSDAADANDDGRIDISDAVYTLNYLFSTSEQDFGELGREVFDETTYDELDCDATNVPVHSVCAGNICRPEIGEGEDECSSSLDCCSSSDATEEYPEGLNPFVFEEGESCSVIYPNMVLERHCISRSSRSNIGIVCLPLGDYICQNGVCVQGPQDICVDSDVTEEYPDGRNRFVRGTITNRVRSYEYTDRCSGRSLIEYICEESGNYDSEIIQNCGTAANGERLNCQDGACPQVHTICRDNACVLAEGVGEDECRNQFYCGVECSDSDATAGFPDGDNIFVQGIASSGRRDFCSSSDPNLVFEYSCLRSAIIAETRDCPQDHTCVNGACIPR